MIKELVLDYIFKMNKNEDLSASEFKVLVSILERSENLGWTPVVKMSNNDISKESNVGTTTIMSSLETLIFSGIISVDSRTGTKKTITILFIRDIISSKEVSGKTKESTTSVIKRHLSFNEDKEKLIILQNKAIAEEENEAFDFIRESDKNGMELSEYTKSRGMHLFSEPNRNLKKQPAGNFWLLRSAPLGNIFTKIKKVARFERLKSKNVTVAKETLSISVQALLPANSLNLNDLENPPEEELKIYADFLQNFSNVNSLVRGSTPSSSYIYIYIKLLYLLDKVMFSSCIYRQILPRTGLTGFCNQKQKKITKDLDVDPRVETSQKKIKEKKRKESRDVDPRAKELSGADVPFQLKRIEKKIKKEMPELLEKQEYVRGRTVDFLTAFEEWMRYSIEKGNESKIRFYSLLENARELNEMKYPILSILTSIKEDWNKIYEQNSTNNPLANDNPYGLGANKVPQEIMEREGLEEYTASDFYLNDIDWTDVREDESYDEPRKILERQLREHYEKQKTGTS